MQPCICQPTESPFTCARSGCEMTARQHDLCSGVNCTARQHVKHARLFAGQRCGEPLSDSITTHESTAIPHDVQKNDAKTTQKRRNVEPKRTAKTSRKGPGSHLKAILAELGVTERICGCNEYAAKMDKWGVEECRMRRPEIVEHLNSAATWRDKIAVAVGAARTLALWLNPLDAAGSLLEEACRRAEEKEATA
jgi:hypothetical protein